MTSMSYKPKPTIWSSDTGQRIPCFDGCNLKTYAINQHLVLAQYGCHVVRGHQCRWAHTPAIHAASYVDHEKKSLGRWSSATDHKHVEWFDRLI